MPRLTKLASLLAVALLLGACAQDNRPVVDPHNQVPFPGSKPIVDPDAVSPDRGGPIEGSVVQVPDPAGDPRCARLDADTLKPAYRCTHDGVSYVLQ